MSTASPIDAAHPAPQATPHGQRLVRIAALVTAAASVVPIIATANAGQVQAAAGRQIACTTVHNIAHTAAAAPHSSHSRPVPITHDRAGWRLAPHRGPANQHHTNHVPISFR